MVLIIPLSEVSLGLILLIKLLLTSNLLMKFKKKKKEQDECDRIGIPFNTFCFLFYTVIEYAPFCTSFVPSLRMLGFTTKMCALL